MARWSRSTACTRSRSVACRPERVRAGRRREFDRQHLGRNQRREGGVLPGVTVTATSPSMIGALTPVTNENGHYRFPAVPPGEYR